MFAEEASFLIFDKSCNNALSLLHPSGEKNTIPCAPSSPLQQQPHQHSHFSATTTGSNSTPCTLLVSAVFRKSRTFRILQPFAFLLATSIWLCSKSCYAYALIRIYMLFSAEFHYGAQYSLLASLFFALFGALMSAIVIDILFSRLADRLLLSEQLPTSSVSKNSSILHQFLFSQLSSIPRVARYLPVQQDWKDCVDEKPILAHTPSVFASVKMVWHSMWFLVPLVLWAYSLVIVNPMRLIMTEYSEFILVLLIGTNLGWVKKSKQQQFAFNFQILGIFLVGIVLYSLVNDFFILRYSYHFSNVFIPNTSLAEFLTNMFGMVLLLTSIVATILRKNHSRKIGAELFPGSSMETIQHRIFWSGVTWSLVALIPLLFIQLVWSPLYFFSNITSISHACTMGLYGALVITLPFYADKICKELVDVHRSHAIESNLLNSSSSTHTSNSSNSNSIIQSILSFFSPVNSYERLAPSLNWRMMLSFILITFVFGDGCHFFSIIATPCIMYAVVEGSVSPALATATAQQQLQHNDTLNNNNNNYTGDTLLMNNLVQSTSQLVKHKFSGVIEGFINSFHFIMSNRDSRYMLLFLVANLCFMCLEFLYGMWSNSLGLISDSAHMLFDCSALVIGLYGAFMSKWKPDHTYTYGFSRFEVISGFVNGLLLVFIAIYILVEAVHRLFDPPHIEGERLLLVSVGGFLLNLLGVLFFHGDAHQNDNMVGVYLHMLADLMGSVAVITSTLAIQMFNLHIADSICSIVVSGLIVTASYPLLTHSSGVLMQRIPNQVKVTQCLEQVEQLDGVLQITNPHVWTMSSLTMVASLHIKVKPDVNEQTMQRLVSDVFRTQLGVTNLTIEIHK